MDSGDEHPENPEVSTSSSKSRKEDKVISYTEELFSINNYDYLEKI